MTEPFGERTADVPADPVRAYVTGIGRTELLTHDEEVVLAKRIEAGLYAEHVLDSGVSILDPATRTGLHTIVTEGRAAKNRFLEANLRLVISVAKRHTGRGMSLADLIREGNLGLVHAVEKWDHGPGYRFSSYATWWIRQAIGRALVEGSRTIRIPVHPAERVDRC